MMQLPRVATHYMRQHNDDAPERVVFTVANAAEAYGYESHWPLAEKPNEIKRTTALELLNKWTRLGNPARGGHRWTYWLEA